jgi:hypothetical protein
MKTKISLYRLFEALLSPITSREYVGLPEEDNVATTIRLDPEIRRYYEDAANELGLSLQAMIKIALTGLMKVSQNETKTEINLIIDRFFEIFAAYHIPTVDIPKILLPYKIPLSVIAHEERLLDILDSDVLGHIAKLFNINVGWLKGIGGYDGKIVNSQYKWYKSPVSFCQYLNELSHENFQPEVLFFSDSSEKKMHEDRLCDPNDSSQVGVVLKIPKKTECGISYSIFEVYEYGSWGYEKSRIDLKVIMLFCHRNDYTMRGHRVKKPTFVNLFNGDVLPITIVENSNEYWVPYHYLSPIEGVNTDVDELMEVIDNYCEHDKITQHCDKKGKRRIFLNDYPINLDNYKYSETKRIEELLN